MSESFKPLRSASLMGHGNPGQLIPWSPMIAAAVKVYADNPTTANRMRKRIRTVLRFGETRTVRGHKPAVVHHPSIPAKDIPALMVELAALDSPDARAMR